METSVKFDDTLSDFEKKMMKMKVTKKEYRLITCQCGLKIKKCSYHGHIKSKRHMETMKEIKNI